VRRAIDKLKNPSAKYPTNADKVKGEKVRSVLRQEPLDVREFIGLMESYFERESGIQGSAPGLSASRTRLVSEVATPSPVKHFTNNCIEAMEITQGDRRLRQIVWTKDERVNKMIDNGEEAPSHKLAKRMEQLLAERKSAEEERKPAEQQWKAMNDAVGKIEEEIEVEDTTTAMDKVAIGQKMPWEEDLVDRTRD
jgi:hypothetical protein